MGSMHRYEIRLLIVSLIDNGADRPRLQSRYHCPVSAGVGIIVDILRNSRSRDKGICEVGKKIERGAHTT